jgi:hypothetical protein
VNSAAGSVRSTSSAIAGSGIAHLGNDRQIRQLKLGAAPALPGR